MIHTLIETFDIQYFLRKTWQSEVDIDRSATERNNAVLKVNLREMDQLTFFFLLLVKNSYEIVVGAANGLTIAAVAADTDGSNGRAGFCFYGSYMRSKS